MRIVAFATLALGGATCRAAQEQETLQARLPNVDLQQLRAESKDLLYTVIEHLNRRRDRFSWSWTDWSKQGGYFLHAEKLVEQNQRLDKFFERRNVAGQALRLVPDTPSGTPVLSVRNSSLIIPGDIIVVKRKDGRAYVLVYAGEDKFADSNKARSFFIYPFTPKSGMEVNTFPPRWHFRLLYKEGRLEQRTGGSGYVFTNSERGVKPTIDSKCGVRLAWLKAPGVPYKTSQGNKTSYFVRESWWTKKQYTVAVFRRKQSEFERLWALYPASLEWVWERRGVDSAGNWVYPCAMALSRTLDVKVQAGESTWKLIGNGRFERVLGPQPGSFGYYTLSQELANRLKQLRGNPQYLHWPKDKLILQAKTGILFFQDPYPPSSTDHIDFWNGPMDRVRMVFYPASGRYGDADFQQSDPNKGEGRLHAPLATARQLWFWEID